MLFSSLQHLLSTLQYFNDLINHICVPIVNILVFLVLIKNGVFDVPTMYFIVGIKSKISVFMPCFSQRESMTHFYV